MDLREQRVRTILQLAILSDISDSSSSQHEVTATRSRKIADRLRETDPTLYQTLKLDQLIGPFGRLASPALSKQLYANIGLDGIVVGDAKPKLANPAFTSRYADIGFEALAFKSNGKIDTNFSHQKILLGQVGLGSMNFDFGGWPEDPIGQIGRNPRPTLREKFNGVVTQDGTVQPISTLRQKFTADMGMETASEPLTALQKKFQAPNPVLTR